MKSRGGDMRLGLVFVAFFAILILVYFLLQDSLGTVATFMLQTALVIVVLAGAAWMRYGKRPTGWLSFGTDDEETNTP